MQWNHQRMVFSLREFWEEIRPHKGKVFGSLLGLAVSWIIIRYGVIRGLFVVLCIAIGWYLGSRWDTNGDISDLMDRFLR